MAQVKNIKKARTSSFQGAVSVLTNVLLIYLVTLVMLLALAIAITYSDFPESYSQAAIMAITVISIIMVGLFVARGANSYGWLWGAIAAAVYMLLLYMISSLAIGSFSISGGYFVMLLIALLCGSIGGIIGINLKPRR